MNQQELVLLPSNQTSQRGSFADLVKIRVIQKSGCKIAHHVGLHAKAVNGPPGKGEFVAIDARKGMAHLEKQTVFPLLGEYATALQPFFHPFSWTGGVAFVGQPVFEGEFSNWLIPRLMENLRSVDLLSAPPCLARNAVGPRHFLFESSSCVFTTVADCNFFQKLGLIEYIHRWSWIKYEPSLKEL